MALIMVVSTRPLAYRVKAIPIMIAASSVGPRTPINFLKLNTSNGHNRISGQTLNRTTLQEPDSPAFSMVLNGNQ